MTSSSIFLLIPPLLITQPPSSLDRRLTAEEPTVAVERYVAAAGASGVDAGVKKGVERVAKDAL